MNKSKRAVIAEVANISDASGSIVWRLVPIFLIDAFSVIREGRTKCVFLRDLFSWCFQIQMLSLFFTATPYTFMRCLSEAFIK